MEPTPSGSGTSSETKPDTQPVESASSGSPPAPSKPATRSVRPLRWLVALMLSPGMLFIMEYVAFTTFVDVYLDGVVKTQLTAFVAQATDSLYRLELDSLHLLSVGPQNVSVKISGVRFIPALTEEAQLARRRVSGDKAELCYTLALKALTLRRLGWRKIIGGGGLTLQSLELDSLTALLVDDRRTPPPNALSDSVRKSRADSLLAARAGAEKSAGGDSATSDRVTQLIPNVSVDSIRLSSATVRYDVRTDTGGTSEEFKDFTLFMRRLFVDAAKPDTLRPLYCDDIRFSIPNLTRTLPDSLYAVRLYSLSLSTADSVLRMDSVRFAPPMSDAAFYRKKGFQTDRFKIETDAFTVNGLDWQALLRRQSLFAREVVMDKLWLEVLGDKRYKEPPKPWRPPLFHESFQKLKVPLRIDSVKAAGASVRYTEHARTAPRSSSLTFEQMDAALFNVTNDPQRMTTETPFVAEIESRFMGSARLRTRFELPLLEKGFDVKLSVKLGATRVERLNPFVIDIVRVKFTDGDIERVGIELAVKNGVASGTVTAIYRNLAVQVLPKHGLKSGLKEAVFSFLANRIKLKGHNAPDLDKPVRTGFIRRTRKPDEAFFQFLWFAVRGGLASIVGL